MNVKELKREDDYWVYPKLSKYLHKVENVKKDKRLLFLDLQGNVSTPLNLYIHIPFCESRCKMCPYYKISPNNEMVRRYVDALIDEMEFYASKKFFEAYNVSSIHIGGGNPFLLEVEQFSKILGKAKDLFGFQVTQDNISVEGSVDCITSIDYIRGLLALGINRFSLGIQTFDENIRKSMGIKARVEDIYKCVSVFKEAGFKKYCFDLMYNMPEQSEEIFISDLEKCDELDPYHIDIYNMAVFPNTVIDQNIRLNKYSIIPSNERSIEMYNVGREWFQNKGYKQIMTQTFSKYEERPDLHDYLYLRDCNVLGIGCSSRGYLDGLAYKNYGTYKEYIERLDSENIPIELMEKFSEEEMSDRIMIFFPILMHIDVDQIRNIDRFDEKIRILKESGLLKQSGKRLELTHEGVLWSGNVSKFFMSQERWKEYISIFMNSFRYKNNPYNEDDMGVTNDEKYL